MARILIIEDEQSIQEVYKALLEDEYDLAFACTGQEGFRKATVEDFDLIIADLHMSSLSWDGAEAVAALEIVKPNIKYVVVSAYLHERKFQETLNTIPNIVAQIPKPFNNDELCAVLTEALSN